MFLGSSTARLQNTPGWGSTSGQDLGITAPPDTAWPSSAVINETPELPDCQLQMSQTLQRDSRPQLDVISAGVPPKYHLFLVSKAICHTGASQVLEEERGRSWSHLPMRSTIMSFRAGILPPNPSLFDKHRNHPLNLQTAVKSLYITLKIN